MCAEGNMSVVNLTTPANLFHGLRRQVAMAERKPLVVMSPKSLLRHPAVVSSPEDFTTGFFREVIPADNDDSEAVRRVVFCSGKVYYDLREAAEADAEVRATTALVRVEQLYPFPSAAITAEAIRFPNASEFVWSQEEPRNMGGWTFVSPRLDEALSVVTGKDSGNIRYRGRASSASPSSGSAKVHQVEQLKLIGETLGS
jgi:2-oxoglutarate dehydrogenase E1 component